MSYNYFVTAPIGGGKSLWGTIKICEALEHTEDLIVTNIPIMLHLPRVGEQQEKLAAAIARAKRNALTDEEMYWTLQEYCDLWVKKPVNVLERVIFLNEEQSKEFYRYIPRGGVELTDEEMSESGVTMWRTTEDKERASYGYKLPIREHKQLGRVGDYRIRARGGPQSPSWYGRLQRPCQYHMDEFHKLYPARAGAAQLALEDYESELRKLEDCLTKYSQHPEKVEKNCRRNATGWWGVKNMSKHKLMLGVTLKKRFHYEYYNQPEMPAKTDKPESRGSYFLDGGRRYEWLYRTLQGSSIAGGSTGVYAETNEVKGRHPIVWVLLVVGVLVAAYLIPRMVQKGVALSVHGLVNGVETGVADGLKGQLGTNAGLSAPSGPKPAQTQSTNLSPAVRLPAYRPPANRTAPDGPQPGAFVPVATVKAVGLWKWQDGNYWVMLDNGETVKDEDVLDVGKHWVKLMKYGKVERMDHPVAVTPEIVPVQIPK